MRFDGSGPAAALLEVPPPRGPYAWEPTMRGRKPQRTCRGGHHEIAHLQVEPPCLGSLQPPGPEGENEGKGENEGEGGGGDQGEVRLRAR